MDPESRFRAIFVVAYPALGRYALNRGLSRADAEDLVAATLEIAWRKIDQVPTDDPIPWLYAVERNLLRNLRRADRRRSSLLERIPVPAPQPAPDHESLSSRQKLRIALEALGDEDQEILKLVAWDDLAPSQAAVALGISAVAARTRLHRARGRLAFYSKQMSNASRLPDRYSMRTQRPRNPPR